MFSVYNNRKLKIQLYKNWKSGFSINPLKYILSKKILFKNGFNFGLLNLIKKEAEADFRKKINAVYQSKFGIIPEIYTANLSEGVHKIA